jgi:hypothetical protein
VPSFWIGYAQRMAAPARYFKLEGLNLKVHAWREMKPAMLQWVAASRLDIQPSFRRHLVWGN